MSFSPHWMSEEGRMMQKGGKQKQRKASIFIATEVKNSLTFSWGFGFVTTATQCFLVLLKAWKKHIDSSKISNLNVPPDKQQLCLTEDLSWDNKEYHSEKNVNSCKKSIPFSPNMDRPELNYPVKLPSFGLGKKKIISTHPKNKNNCEI